MQRSAVTSETGRVEETESHAGSPDDIKFAIRILAIVKGLYQTCLQGHFDSAEMQQLPDLPDWAKNICEQLHRTIFKRLIELKPANEQIEWRNFGRMLGVCQRESIFLGDTAGSNPGTDNSELLDALNQGLLDSMQTGMKQTPEQQAEFFAGFAEGCELFLDSQGQLTGDKGRTSVYFALLGVWMEIEEMRQAVPRKSFSDAYKLLAHTLGDSRGERFDWFYCVCKEIGLGLGTEGRPRKSEKNN